MTDIKKHPLTADLMAGARKLIDNVEFDVNGTHGKGGNGGLTSDETIRSAGELRVILSRIADTPAPADHVRGDSYDADAFMADGGDTPMTAAENVLAWLLIEKIGVPDDVGYSPNQAQEIIVRRLDLARELEEIDAMLAEGQGDDEGHPIMPEFTKGMTIYAKVEACLHLLERRRDALHPSPAPNVSASSRRTCDFPRCDCSSGAMERCSHPPAPRAGG